MFNQRGFISMVSLYDCIHRFGIPLLNLPRWVNTATGMKQDLHPNIEINPFNTNPAHERLYYTIGAYAPYSLPTSVWVFFMSHRNQNSERAMRQHLRFFCPYLRRLECIILCRCHNKGSTFSSFILRPWVLVWPRFEPVTSSSADRHLSNWADRVAEVRAMTHLTITWSLSSYLKLHLVKWIKKIFSWKKHF